MSDEDRDYFLQRAVEERTRAETHPPDDPAAIAYREMAEQYELQAEHVAIGKYDDPSVAVSSLRRLQSD